MKVRDLGYRDLPAVLRIERDAFPAPWSTAMFILELSRPGSVCLAAVDADDAICGYLVCSRLDLDWHLMNIAVPAEQRGGGAADLLMQELVGRLGADSRVTLEVRPSNGAALGLYSRWGFLPAGRRKAYYADSGEDALVMWRTPATIAGRLDDVPAAEEQKL